MNVNKYRAFFQDQSLYLEKLLKEYKNQYPKSLGAMVSNYFPTFLIIMSVAWPIGVFGLMKYDDSNPGITLGSAFLPLALLVIGIVLYRRNKKEKKEDPTILTKINTAKATIEPFAQYPDVKDYLDQYNNQIKETDKTKQSIRQKFFLVLMSLIVMYFFVFAIYPQYVRAHKPYGRCDNVAPSGLLEVWGVETHKPFIRLAPLKKEIYGDCRIASDTLDFYYSEIYTTSLRLDSLAMENVEEGDVFRLLITDKDGMPVPGCGRFVFVMVGTKASDYVSYWGSTPLCPERKYNPRDTIRGKIVSNEFCTHSTAKYLLENQDSLFFVVDRIKKVVIKHHD